MKAVVTLVTIVCGTLMLLSPTFGPRDIHPDYYMWSQIAGIGMSLAGVVMGVIVVGRPSSAACEVDATAA